MLAIMGFGFPELMVLLLLCVVIFGAKRLPQLGQGLGSAIRNFKDSVSGKEDKQIESEHKD